LNWRHNTFQNSVPLIYQGLTGVSDRLVPIRKHISIDGFPKRSNGL